MSDERLTPMGSLVPPPVLGSPADMGQAPDDALNPEHMLPLEEDGPYWRPGVLGLLKVVGWRWVILGPALIVAIGLPIEAALNLRLLPMVAGFLKIWIFAVGVGVSIVLWAARNAVKARKDEFCIHCGYTLDGLGESGACPECGRPFHLSIVHEYRKDPHFFATRRKALKEARRSVVFRAGDGPTADDGTR